MNTASSPQSQNAEKFVLVEDGYHNTEAESNNKKENGRAPADFEEAITACGYGKFHYWMFFGLIPVGSATLFSSGAISYVYPVAECDLQLTDYHKGALNAGAYAGMIMSSFLWGFASDIFGRRKLLIAGFFLDATFILLTSVANSFWLLLMLRILGGTAITGPNALLYSYLAEIHDNVRRPKVIMITGAFIALAQVIQPALAFIIIPLQFHFELIPGLLDFTPWRLFLFACFLPSFLSAIVFFMVPESPKFLLSRGRVDEALDSFRRIYAKNTGNPPLSYPIKELQAPPELAAQHGASASSPSSRGIAAVLRSGWIQVRPIFRPPHLNVAILIFSIQTLIMLCLNSVRLWMTQLFATLDEAAALALENPLESTTTPTVCDLLGSVDSRTVEQLAESGHTCPPVSTGNIHWAHMSPNLPHFLKMKTKRASLRKGNYMLCSGSTISPEDIVLTWTMEEALISHDEELSDHVIYNISGSIYLRSLFIGATTTLSFFVTIVAVGYIGKGALAKTCFPLAAAVAFSMNWATNSNMFTLMIAGYIAMVGNALTAMNSLMVDLFPTTFRSLAISLNMMCGRTASVVGNLIFPVLLNFSCSAVFFLMGGVLATNSLLVWLIPNRVEVR